MGDVGRSGSKYNGASRRTNESLNDIIDVVNRRDLIGQEFDHAQKEEHSDHPPGSERIPGTAELHQIGEFGQQRHRQQGDVGVQPGACRKP
ncbi:hypothetical protein SDC9_198806 [bioreactor metagenome]|uniref:Uncharacterized protein n=1 Tax=bioreactor metagenome TaxID=1076179 RepID=A0A645IRY5_9ZZZZ